MVLIPSNEICNCSELNLTQRVKQDRDRFLRDCLGTVSHVLAVTFVLVMLFDFALLGQHHPAELLVLGSCTVLTFLALAHYVSRKTISPGYANPIAAVIVGSVLVNLLARECLASSQHNISILAMFTVSLGIFFLSTAWLTGCLIISMALMSAVFWLGQRADFHELLTLQMAAATFCLVLHIFRVRTFTRMSEIRISDELLTAELQEAVSLSRESENKFRRLSESVPFGIFQVDLDGNCVYSNNIYRSLCVSAGVTSIAHRWVDILPEAMRAHTHQQWLVAAREFTSFSGVYLQQTLPGETRWLEVLLSPVFSDDGAVFVGTVEDITE